MNILNDLKTILNNLHNAIPGAAMPVSGPALSGGQPPNPAQEGQQARDYTTAVLGHPSQPLPGEIPYGKPNAYGIQPYAPAFMVNQLNAAHPANNPHLAPLMHLLQLHQLSQYMGPQTTPNTNEPMSQPSQLTTPQPANPGMNAAGSLAGPSVPPGQTQPLPINIPNSVQGVR